MQTCLVMYIVSIILISFQLTIRIVSFQMYRYTALAVTQQNSSEKNKEKLATFRKKTCGQTAKQECSDGYTNIEMDGPAWFQTEREYKLDYVLLDRGFKEDLKWQRQKSLVEGDHSALLISINMDREVRERDPQQPCIIG